MARAVYTCTSIPNLKYPEYMALEEVLKKKYVAVPETALSNKQ